jgi:cytochrome c nitrite reductase small subunit
MIIERAGKLSFFRYILLGLLIGILIAAAAVLGYQESGDARFCGSCHSMKTVYGKWQASNHRQFTCTECHLPDTHIVGKVAYKTQAGLNDLVHETIRDYPASVGLSDAGRAIVKKNCVRCHAATIAETKMTRDGADCLKCHRYLAHGRGLDEGGIQVEK